jgi:hypothetical protein
MRIAKQALALSLAVGAAAAAVACGGGQRAASRVARPAPTPSVNCTDPNLSEQDIERLCGAPNAPTLQIGEPFPQVMDDSGALFTGVETVPPLYHLSVTVTNVRCGITSYPFTADAGSGEQPARASPGNQFCQAMTVAMNVGHGPIADTSVYILDDVTLSTRENTYAADALSQAISDKLADQLYAKGVNTGSFAGEVVNPGATATQVLVWQVPASETVDTFEFKSPSTLVAMN